MKIYDITAPVFEGITVYKNKLENNQNFRK